MGLCYKNVLTKGEKHVSSCSKLTRTLSVRVVIDSPSTQIISVTNIKAFLKVGAFSERKKTR